MAYTDANIKKNIKCEIFFQIKTKNEVFSYMSEQL